MLLGIAATVLFLVLSPCAVRLALRACLLLAGGGLDFPGNERPDWLEFLYLSLTIGMTAQVSDRDHRLAGDGRLVLAHGLVSFAFNAAIIGVAVMVLAGSAAG